MPAPGMGLTALVHVALFWGSPDPNLTTRGVTGSGHWVHRSAR